MCLKIYILKTYIILQIYQGTMYQNILEKVGNHVWKTHRQPTTSCREERSS
jgi:hypothetical protein